MSVAAGLPRNEDGCWGVYRVCRSVGCFGVCVGVIFFMGVSGVYANVGCVRMFIEWCRGLALKKLKRCAGLSRGAED